MGLDFAAGHSTYALLRFNKFYLRLTAVFGFSACLKKALIFPKAVISIVVFFRMSGKSSIRRMGVPIFRHSAKKPNTENRARDPLRNRQVVLHI